MPTDLSWVDMDLSWVDTAMDLEDLQCRFVFTINHTTCYALYTGSDLGEYLTILCVHEGF